jgi:hypothetical protein
MIPPNLIRLKDAVRAAKRKRAHLAASADEHEPEEQEPLPPGFGVAVPLGVSSRRGATTYVFLDAAGLQQALSARDMHTAACISSLYGGETGRTWLARRWPHMTPVRDLDGKIVRDDRGRPLVQQSGDFSARDAGDALMAACTEAGPVDRREMRLDGVWLGPEPGTLAVHCGDTIMAAGEAHAPGWQHGPAVYLAAAARPRPGPVEASPEEVAQLWSDLNLWRFAAAQADAGPALLLGMIANGILAAALPWRPHMLLRGPFGAGKSALMQLVAAATGGGLPTTDTSEAALRQGYDSRAVLIPVDEAEANGGHIARILDLMRGASGRQGAVTSRGSSEGEARTFRVNGCFLLAAITPVVLAPADASRITRLQLLRPEAASDNEVEAAIRRAGALYPALLSRLANRFGIYLANRAAVRAAAVAAKATSRAADQLAALLAGWQVLMHDEPLDEASAAHLLDGFRDFYSTEEETAEDDTPQLVLQHLLASRVPIGDHKIITVSGALSAAWLDRDAELAPGDWTKNLGALRLRLTSDPPGLWVGNGSPALEAVFKSTRWEGRVWEAPLRDLPGARESPSSMRFTHGGQARAAWLPLNLLGLNIVEPQP